MHVIGAGFGRTGTLSLKAALERIGFGPCYHMSELIGRPDDAQLWVDAKYGELDDWSRLLGEYGSTTDFPGCVFWRELMDAYPDAKVVLTVRDSDRWYESLRNTVLTMMRSAREAGDDRQIPDFGPPPHMMRVSRDIISDVFDNRVEDRAHAIEVFERHNQQVREGVPADRLLEYEVSQGWEPLCAFLGVDVPDEEFPRLNDAANFVQEVNKVKQQHMNQAQ